MSRRPSARRRSRGVALAEFLIAGMLVLLPLTLAVLELAQLMVARNALTYATFEAARAGAVRGASRGDMRAALARGLIPLFAPFDPAALLRGAPGAVGAGPGAAARALARATLEVQRPDLTRLEIENPTRAAVADFGTVVDGEVVIPNDNLDLRNPYGATSGQTLRDANVLAIRVRYCRPLVMPLISRVVPALLRWSLSGPFDQFCLARGRVPIDAAAVVHMQSAARAAELPGGG
jgi:TadE-like protein